MKAEAGVEVRTLSKKQYLELKGRRGRKSAVDAAAMAAYEAAAGTDNARVFGNARVGGNATAAAPKKASKVNAVASAPVKAGKKAAVAAPAAKKTGKKVDVGSFFDEGDDR